MSFGNVITQGSKGNNTQWQRAMLKLASAAGLGQTAKQDFGAVTGSTITIPIFTTTPVYQVFKNGQLLTNIIDYSIAGNTIMFVNPLVADLITVIFNF